MSKSPPSEDTLTLPEAMAAYSHRLGELLDQCARHQIDDPEAFLWNARRALEVLCHLLLSAHRDRTSRSNEGGKEWTLMGIVETLHKEGVLPAQQRIRFNAAREHANLGVHIRKPEREDYRAARDDLAHLLPALVRWVYTESKASPFLRLDDHLQSTLADFDAEGRTATAPALVQATVFDEADSAGGASAPRRQRTVEGSGAARRWAWGMSALLLVLGASGAGLATFAWLAPTSQGGSAEGAAANPPGAGADGDGPATPAEGAPTAPEIAAPADDGAAPPSSPAPPASAPNPATSCPTGMVYVEAPTIQIGQPTGRKDWPEAIPTRIERQEVAPFCIDAEPRSRAQLGEWEGGKEWAAQAATVECNRTSNAVSETSPAGCVSRDVAQVYCRSVHAGGSLPSLIQWEAVKREANDAGVGGGIYREWVADLFPPAVLNRRRGADLDSQEGLFREPLKGKSSAEGGLLLSWNRRQPYLLLNNLGFRCAAPPR
jgi:hypothetical protein